MLREPQAKILPHWKSDQIFNRACTHWNEVWILPAFNLRIGEDFPFNDFGFLESWFAR